MISLRIGESSRMADAFAPSSRTDRSDYVFPSVWTHEYSSRIWGRRPLGSYPLVHTGGPRGRAEFGVRLRPAWSPPFEF